MALPPGSQRAAEWVAAVGVAVAAAVAADRTDWPVAQVVVVARTGLMVEVLEAAGRFGYLLVVHGLGSPGRQHQ